MPKKRGLGMEAGEAEGPAVLSPLSAPKQNIAAILKALRNRAGLTLGALSKRADVGISTISKIESGQLSPGYEVILRLAMGLQVDVAELFRPKLEDVPTGRRGITRSGAGSIHRSDQYIYEALSADVSNKKFLPLRVTIKARSREEFDKLPVHIGEEFVFILTGAVELYSDHYEPLLLQPGDSVYFDSRSGHALVSIGPEDATVMWICSHQEALPQAR